MRYFLLCSLLGVVSVLYRALLYPCHSVYMYACISVLIMLSMTLLQMVSVEVVLSEPYTI